MSIAPIIRTVTVKAPPAQAFELFTQSMGKWWPKGIGQKPHVEIVMEPRVGGRWYERDADGVETQWGDVVAWEAPQRVLLAWRLNSRWKYDASFSTALEILFKPADGGGTTVTLVHSQLERYGDDAQKHADALRGGWPTILERYATYSDTNRQ